MSYFSKYRITVVMKFEMHSYYCREFYRTLKNDVIVSDISKYRITAVMKLETRIISIIVESPIGHSKLT